MKNEISVYVKDLTKYINAFSIKISLYELLGNARVSEGGISMLVVLVVRTKAMPMAKTPLRQGSGGLERHTEHTLATNAGVCIFL